MGILVLAVLVLVVLALISLAIVKGAKGRRARRRAAVERELDRSQAELYAQVMSLASELSANALAARTALIRESYLASGRTPDQP